MYKRMPTDLVSDACCEDALRFFRSVGIVDPTPCQLAWYSFLRDVSRAKQSTLNSKFASHLFHLLVERQGLPVDEAKDLCWLLEYKVPDSHEYIQSCASLTNMCVPWSCPFYGSRNPENDPSFGDFQETNTGDLETEIGRFFDDVPGDADTSSETSMRLLQVPMAGGKTYHLAGLAWRLMKEEIPFYVIIDTHESGCNFFGELSQRMPKDLSQYADRRIVLMVGLDRAICAAVRGESRSCNDCHQLKRIYWFLMTHPVDRVIFCKESLKSLARDAGIRCLRACSLVLIPSASAVVMAQNFILDASILNARPRIPSKEKTEVILWDEADTLLDCASELAVREFPVIECASWSEEGPSKKPVYKRGRRCNFECGSCRLYTTPESLSKPIETGIAVYEQICKNNPGVQPKVSVDAVRHNMNWLHEYIGQHVTSNRLPWKLVRELRDRFDQDPVGLSRPDFRSTTELTDAKYLGNAVLSQRRKGRCSMSDVERLFTPQHIENVTSQDIAQLQAFLRFADVTNGKDCRLEINMCRDFRPFWTTPCTATLRRFDSKTMEPGLEFIRNRHSLLVSGTVLDAECFASQVGIPTESIDYRDLGSRRMHNAVVFLVWNHRIGTALKSDRMNPLVPMMLRHRHVLELVTAIAQKSAECDKALIFADGKNEAGRLIDQCAEKPPTKDRFGRRKPRRPAPWFTQLIDVKVRPEKKEAEKEHRQERMPVHVSYLRSDISRGSAQDQYQVSILYGNGFQHGGDARLQASIEQEEMEQEEFAERLVRYGRQRAVAQAATRIPRNGDKRRLVMLVGDFGPFDLPDYLLNRVLFANEIFERAWAGERLKDEERHKWQFERVAEWVAGWISSDPDGRDLLLDFMPEHGIIERVDSEAVFRDLCARHEKELRLVTSTMADRRFVALRGDAGYEGHRKWGWTLRKLWDIGVLMRDLKDKAKGKEVYIRGPLYHLLEQNLNFSNPE